MNSASPNTVFNEEIADMDKIELFGLVNKGLKMRASGRARLGKTFQSCQLFRRVCTGETFEGGTYF